MSSESTSPITATVASASVNGAGVGGETTRLSDPRSNSTTSSTTSLAALAAAAAATTTAQRPTPNSTVNLSDLILATDTTSSPMTQSTSANSSSGSGMVLNEKVASLASSIYTELEKVIKAHGRDTVKDLMALVVNVLEALDVAYHEKEELSVDNELLKDDYEKLLSQYEREKQHRKDAELVVLLSFESFQFNATTH